ncbi:MAG: response regulator [Sedimentisphaeraceae bacterium JB056]
MNIKILLADDHAIVRHGLGESIQQQDDMKVVGNASDGRMTVDLAFKLKPDIIIMDISMPLLNGFEAAREILHDNPDIKIIALSMHSSKRFVSEMLKAGASAYLLKDCEFEELLKAIRIVADGQTYLSPSISDVVIDNFVRSDDKDSSSVFSTLTQRERQVLQMIAEGNTTKQIANSLYISPKTVEAHRLNVMNKLEIDNVAQLTKYAIQEGLTSVEM